jgi:hypothetical protein
MGSSLREPARLARREVERDVVRRKVTEDRRQNCEFGIANFGFLTNQPFDYSTN